MYYPPNNQPYYLPQYQPHQPFHPYDSEKRELRKTACGLGWAFFVALVSPAVLALIGKFFLSLIGYQFSYSDGWGGFTPILYYLFSGAIYTLFLVVPFTIYLKIKHLPVVNVLPFEHVSILTAIACVCFGVAVCMLANIPANIVVTILQSMGFSGNLPSEPKTENLYANILYCISIMVIPPFVEEFVFRGVILSRLRKYGDGFAIFGSAFLFGMFHGNFIQIPFAFIVGLALAFIVVRTGNLWITVAIHAINNSFSLLYDFLERYQGKEYAAQITNWIMLALIVIGILSLVFLCMKNQQFFHMDKPKTLMPASTRWSALIWNVGMMAAMVYCVGNAIYMLVSY